jgi:hypothetical protein
MKRAPQLHRATIEAAAEAHELDDDFIAIPRALMAHIRDMLIFGLECYGELERLEATIDRMKLRGEELPKSLVFNGATCGADTVSRFAAALSYACSEESRS